MAPLTKILAAGALTLVAALLWQHNREVARHDPRHGTGNDGIVMLTASWCGYCHQLKKSFDAAGVKYAELDVEESREGELAYQALHGHGVPMTVVGQDVVYGYDAPRINELLAERGYPQQVVR